MYKQNQQLFDEEPDNNDQKTAEDNNAGKADQNSNEMFQGLEKVGQDYLPIEMQNNNSMK
jgi:hypothetical protein